MFASAEFYRDVIGLTPETGPTETWAWFWVGEPGQPQRLALHKGSLLFEEHSPHPPGARWGPIHFALQVERANLEAAAARARASGMPVFGPTRFD